MLGLNNRRQLVFAFLGLLIGNWIPGSSSAHDLKTLAASSKPSIVGIGTRVKTRRPPNILRGTGFVVGDGRTIVTNAHVIPEIDDNKFEQLVIFIGTGRKIEYRPVTVHKKDEKHDLAVLHQSGKPLPSLKLAPAEPFLAEGSAIAFIGYPIGGVLGLYPVIHGGYLSAITPVVIPAAHSNTLTAAQVRTLKDPYFVYQLDATAYPGNSGSPVFDADTGHVVAIVNKVFVKSTKENVLSDPSAITYAIPVRFLRALLQ